MSATCPFCEQSFSSSRGLVFSQDAQLLRDAHVLTCEANPRNRCFCGAVFPNHAAKDKHAATCPKNPSNQFKCMHCSQEFLNSFGIMGRLTADGKALRDAHSVTCKDNPANTCFCGNLFPNPEARNAHAVTCDMNPANRYQCQFCQAQFVKTFNMFGFCSRDGRADRDAHQISCEKNPKNQCFCGKIFPNPSARDRHAATCEENPVNRFQCSFCKRLFVTRFGVMGRIACDGKSLRDTHQVGCEKNPANVCFCGQLFLNPTARDAHAVKCEMNPVNRFSCQYCRRTFVTKFGIFSSSGSIERDAHMLVCNKNPANAACRHCNRTFTDTKGPLGWIYAEAHKRCESHVLSCRYNPQNRFHCDRCGKCFVTSRRLFLKSDGRLAREQHHKECDFIPCDFEVKDSDIDDWLLMSAGSTTEPSDTITAGDDYCVLGRSSEFAVNRETICQPCNRSDIGGEDASDAVDNASFNFHDAESSQEELDEENEEEEDDDEAPMQDDSAEAQKTEALQVAALAKLRATESESDEEMAATKEDELDTDTESDKLDDFFAKEDSDSELEASFVPLASDADFTSHSES
mmetsp:Transcript_107750/g.170108  ORF Transcript_107750/g.170108 Transcript_107750/m.170108 type:complete len:575 (-) Transcript_107750:78-1802(-)